MFFPVDIFRGSNRLFDSVIDAESHDIKILTGFPFLIKNRKFVGGTNMLRRKNFSIFLDF